MWCTFLSLLVYRSNLHDSRVLSLRYVTGRSEGAAHLGTAFLKRLGRLSRLQHGPGRTCSKEGRRYSVADDCAALLRAL